MIDHVGLDVQDYETSLAFYRKALAPLDYELVVEIQGWAGFGRGGVPTFWIRGGRKTSPAVHIALRARNRDQVGAFHVAALAAGGRDNGEPGPRTHYHEHYFGAFILDPDGHNIEAVCHDPA